MQKVKEHYVPQFYLRGFTDNNGLLHVYNLNQKKFYTQIPKNICFEKNLYETEWKDANPKLGKYVLVNSIENEFCRYENEFAELVRTITNVCTSKQNQNALILHGEEKEVLCRFVVNLMLRNPSNMELLALSDIPKDVKRSDGFLLFKDIMKKMGLGGAESIYLAAQKKAMLTEELESSFPKVYAEYLKNICFTFFYAEDGNFVTSDVPVCFGKDWTISDEDKTCLYIAVTSKIALLFGNYNMPQTRKNRMVRIKSEIVELFNKQMAKHFNRINMLIGNSKELIEKYVEEMRICPSTNTP